MPRSLQHLVRVAFAAAALAACGEKNGTEPARITSVEVTDQNQTAVAGLVVPTAPTFVVKDQHGQPMAGAKVTIVVATGGGTLTGMPTVSATAPVSVGTWTLGQKSGANTLTLTVEGLPPVTVTATAGAGAPAAIEVDPTSTTSALAGTPISAFRAKVRDQFGNGVAGQTLALAITAGGGSLAGTSATTNADGLATFPTWTLGKLNVPQTVHATVGALAADLSAAVVTQFDIDVRFFGNTPMTDAQKALFTNAAARLGGIVIGDIPTSSTGNVDLSAVCLDGLPTLYNETVDDVIIYASVQNIDGPGKILAQAGPCLIRNAAGNNLTVLGVMSFDAADIESLGNGDRLQSVITHEMLHVLGVGTLWGYKTPSLIVNKGLDNVAYTGALGISGCVEGGGSAFCSISVPVENTGGPGTRDGHWRESTFDAELMTGFAEAAGVAMPLSQMTVGALADLGYSINRAPADLFALPSYAARLVPETNEAWESLSDIGLVEVDAHGTRRVVKRPSTVRVP